MATVKAEASNFKVSMSYHHRCPISYVSCLSQSKHLHSLIKINPLPAGNLKNTQTQSQIQLLKVRKKRAGLRKNDSVCIFSINKASDSFVYASGV